MYGECEGSQDKKIMMVSIGKGPRERRRGTKGRYEEKSTTQEENHNNNIQYQVHETIHVLEVQQEKPKEKTPEELVPKEYHKFLKVFLKKESKCMLLQKPWDHTIDLKDTFKLKKGHIIPLSPAEQEEVMAFLDDQLKKGYIHPSK